MKRLSLVLTILVTLLHAHLHAATFTASQIEITPGQTAQLVIGMNNTETNLSGFQFKLYLPEGLSVTTNASGQFVYTQSGRIANHTVNFRALDDGGYLVVVYSMDADVITGSSGELMSISVTADETASTSGNGTLSNIRITDVSSITSSCSDVPINVTILNVHPHDATFTASQIEITPRQTAQLVIGMNNTDTNLSGFQFKLYLPEGLSVTTNDNGQFVYTQSERIANHTVNFRALNDGGYLVVVYSMDANVITGSSGELMSISVTADETASTSGNGTLSSIRITDVSSSTSSCNDVTIDVTIVPKFHYVTFKYGETVYLHEQVAYGAVVPVPEDPMLKGHTFAGWSPDVPETMPDSDLVFTALFTVNQYTVTFTIPSEEWTKEFTLDYGAAITVPDVPQKPGYTFAGWDKPVPETMPDSAIVFTGSYTQNLQILTLTASGNGSVSYGETNVRSASQNFNVGELSQVILTITPDAGHHIASLLLNGENALLLLTEDGKLTIESMTASASVSVTFAPNVHDVTFRYGEIIYQQTQVAYGEIITVPEDPMLKGHTFAGWDKPIPETMPDSALVFTALFTVNQYTVTFTIPSEEWTKEFTLDYGAAITVPDVPQKPGYTFAGWDKPVPETMPDADLVFTGSYTQNLQGLTLTASGNGMIIYGETSVREAMQNFNVAELSQVILTITPDAGHHIASLLLNGENALSLLTEDGKLTIESMTASASVSVTFAPNVHDVTFRYGETIYQQTQVAYGETITVPEDPTLKGHTFAGWDKPIPETMPDSALVFTALFTVNQYTVTFTIPSEEWTKEFTLDYGAAITIPDVPQKPGYTFAGWDKPVPETMPDADLVFTGSYTQNFQTLSLTASGNGTVQYGNTSVRSSSQSFDVAESSDVVLTITPDAGHHVETLTINGEDVLSQMTDGKLNVGSMTASVTVAVTFAANIIDFADANIKALCVANWDTNGDGELDEAEAAAVENLGSVFTENQAITSFNELQYFTGLTSIGDNAFNTCSGLTSVTIPENVTRIGLAAFYQCTGLTAIIIPESVTSIGYSSFRNCTNLTAITIPGNVTSIGNWAFSGCSVLTSIKVYEGNTAYDSRDNCNAIIETATNTLITGCQNTVIPNSVTSIGDTAFGKCSGLTSITIPNSVTSIGKWAFYQCTGLTAIIIPESVTSIGENAFRACKSLTSIKVDEGNSIYDSRDNCNAIIETKSNTLVAGCMNTVIHESVTSIGHGAFGDYTSLTSITIPESVTSIGESAFWGCIGLTNITSHIKEPFAIADDVFEGIPYETATLFVPGGTIDAYKATDGWKNFQNIEVIPQQLTIVAVGDGSVTFSGETLTKTTATFKVAGEVQLLLTPEEDCYIERIMVNQQDCTSQVTDGKLTLNVIDEDYFVLAEFQHNAVEEPDSVTYTIYIDGFGDVRVKDETLKKSEQTIRVPQGSDLVLEFLPNEGQMVDKVTLNGETVTDQVVGNTLVVRDVQEDGTVSVIFMEQIETFEYAGIRYGVTDNTQRTLKVLPYDYSGHLSIPESIEHSQRTWQVQEIGNLAFANCEWLVSVKIPTSITKAGKNLFKRDTRLAAIQWDAESEELSLGDETMTGELTNPNMLYYVKDRSYAPQSGNVIVDGMADNISLSDGHDFYCPEAFKAKKIAYNHIYKMLTRRKSCQGWETLVLPFDVEIIRLSRNPDNPEIYPYESLTDVDKVERGETLPFWLYSYNNDDTFTPAASIEANTPYIISMPNDVAYLPMFRLAGNVTFSAQDVDVDCTSDGNLKVPGTQRHFQPSYQKKVMGNDCFLVNENDSVNHRFAEGSKFIQALRPARPFEAYMISQTASVKPWYDIFEQMPTGIRDIPAINDEEEMANGNKCYDLSGRQIVNSKLSNCKLHRGIYIINGKKQVIK